MTYESDGAPPASGGNAGRGGRPLTAVFTLDGKVVQVPDPFDPRPQYNSSFTHTRPADQRTGRIFVNLNSGRHVAVRFSHLHERLDVAGGRLFSAHVPEVRLVYQRDLRTLMRAIVQYTAVSRGTHLYERVVSSANRDLFVQLLFSYKVNAQTALYLGYVSGASGTDQFDLRNANRTVFAKLSHAWLK